MGRPCTIDRTAVLTAAMAVADRDGLSAVTTRAVAAELSVSTMAMYRHVKDKSELLDGLVECILDELVTETGMPVADVGPGTDPRTKPERHSGDDTTLDSNVDNGHGIAATVRAFLDAAVVVAVRHPTVFPLLLARPVATVSSTRIRARIHRLLRRTGVPTGRLVAAERAVTSTVFGVATGYATGRFTTAPDERDLEATSAFIAAGLSSLLEPSAS